MTDTNDKPTYKQCFGSLAAGLAPFCVLVGIAGFAGSNTVTWNGQYVHGAGALLVAALLNLLFAAIFAGVQKLGYWILSLARARAQND